MSLFSFNPLVWFASVFSLPNYCFHLHPCCGCSCVVLLLSSASDTKARSPLENSVSCLANRTLDDDPRVRRTPSVGWLSKSMGGERAEMVVLGRGREDTWVLGYLVDWRPFLRVPARGMHKDRTYLGWWIAFIPWPGSSALSRCGDCARSGLAWQPLSRSHASETHFLRVDAALCLFPGMWGW